MEMKKEPSLHGFAKAVAKTIGTEIGNAIFDSSTDEISTGIWNVIEEQVYAELKKSAVTLWLSSGELELSFHFGETGYSDIPLNIKIEDLFMPVDPVEWANDHSPDELKSQLDVMDAALAKMRSHKVAIEAAIQISDASGP